MMRLTFPRIQCRERERYFVHSVRNVVPERVLCSPKTVHISSLHHLFNTSVLEYFHDLGDGLIDGRKSEFLSLFKVKVLDFVQSSQLLEEIELDFIPLGAEPVLDRVVLDGVDKLGDRDALGTALCACMTVSTEP